MHKTVQVISKLVNNDCTHSLPKNKLLLKEVYTFHSNYMFPDDVHQCIFQFAVILGFLFLVELGGSITGYVFRHKVST